MLNCIKQYFIARKCVNYVLLLLLLLFFFNFYFPSTVAHGCHGKQKLLRHNKKGKSLVLLFWLYLRKIQSVNIQWTLNISTQKSALLEM